MALGKELRIEWINGPAEGFVLAEFVGFYYKRYIASQRTKDHWDKVIGEEWSKYPVIYFGFKDPQPNCTFDEFKSQRDIPELWENIDEEIAKKVWIKETSEKIVAIPVTSLNVLEEMD